MFSACNNTTGTHTFNGLLSGTTRVSRYLEGKTNFWISLTQEMVSGSGISWPSCASLHLAQDR